MDFDPKYMEEVANNKPLKFHQDLLVYLAQHGYEAAKTKLIQAKQELIIIVSIDYLLSGLTFVELIELGNNGLMQAIQQIDNFDHGNFDDFLKPHILNAIQEGIAHLSK